MECSDVFAFLAGFVTVQVLFWAYQLWRGRK